MESKDDFLYNSTVHQTPRLERSGKSQAPSLRPTPKRRQSPRPPNPKPNLWSLPNLDVLR